MSFNDLSLNCSDCKKHYRSAALLLQHYAQHFIFSYSDAAKVMRAERKRKKKEKLIEEELKVETGSNVSCFLSNSSSSSPSPQSSSFSNSSFEQKKYLDFEQNNNEIRGKNENNSSDVSESEPLNLVKFDLQQCIESKVSLREYDSFFLHYNEKLDVKESIDAKNGPKIKENYVEKESDEKSENDEFSPLTYCMITMDDELNQSNQNNAKSKPDSTEFSLTPVPEIKLNGASLSFRKLAPKPPEGIKSADPEKRSKNTKKYPCQLCDKVFGWSTDLKRHVLIHTGERPFKCQVCSASFTRNFLLQKHQSKIHPCSKSVTSNCSNDSSANLFRLDAPLTLKT